MSEIFTKQFAMKIESSYNCESICAFRDKVLIGTKQGSIIVYTITYERSGDIKSAFDFMIRDLCRKPIIQIELAEKLGIFISLCVGAIYVHQTKDYKLISITEIKAVSKFCFDVYDPHELIDNTSKKKLNEPQSERKENEASLMAAIMNEELVNQSRSNYDMRICVVTNRKLNIMYWDKVAKTFKTSDKIFKIPDYPLTVQFLHNFLCVGTKYEYLLINIETGDMKQLFNVGRLQDPFIVRVSNLLGLKIDDTVEFINKEGTMLSNGNLRWSFVPSIIIYHPPFVISLVDKYIEVRMITPPTLIQGLPVKNASLICRNLDRLYVLSDNKLWVLVSKSRKHQVQQYANSQDFEVAMILAKTASLVGEDPVDSTMININYALSLYENRIFEKSFNIFTEMKVDPSHVLNLFPSICPEKFKTIINVSKYITSAQNFTEEDKIEAIRALIDYLVKWRVKLRKSQDNVQCRSICDGKNIESSKKTLQQIIDTTLLKSYLNIKSPLVAPLLRQENFCHLDETRITLEKAEKYQELVLLYESNELHEDALNLLLSQSVKSNSSLYGIQPTVKYLKNLNSNHLDLIYQYGDLILHKSPMDWLSIFTHWYQKEKLSTEDNKIVMHPVYKENVLNHLQSKCPEMVVPFLERIIYDYNNIEDFDLDSFDPCNQSVSDENSASLNGKLQNSLKYKLLPLELTESLPIIAEPSFANVRNLHTCYIISLINQILLLAPSLLLNLDMKKELKFSSSDRQYVHDLQIRLKMFLQSEKSNYNVEVVLSKLPYDSFHEERTLMLAKMGRHEQALTLWIYLLNDWDQALKHCNAVYQTNKEIFFKLLNVCIEPSDPTSIGIVLPTYEFTSIIDRKHSISENKFSPRLDKALEIMKKYGDKLNPSLAIRLLSSAFEIKDLLPFAQNSLRRQTSQLNQSVFFRNLLFYNRLWSNFKLCISAKKSFVVTENSKCSVCHKLMGSSAFARYPDESLIHYGCRLDFQKIHI